MTVRDARPGDAEAIATIHVAGWRGAYRGVMPDAVLDQLDVAERTEQWQTRLAAAKGDTLVVERGDPGRVVGFCTLAPARDDDCAQDIGEVAAVYVDPAHARQGLGRSLMAQAMVRARERGYRQVILWVLDANPHAQAFYAGLGFKPDGAVQTTTRFSGTPLRKIRYAAPTSA